MILMLTAAATKLNVHPYAGESVIGHVTPWPRAERPANPGALSAERLLEQAWDENTDPFTNTVRVTIGRLRRKLGEPKVIHNTPGIGYRIAIPTHHTDTPTCG